MKVAAISSSSPLIPLLFLLLFSVTAPSLCNAAGSLSSDALALLDFINNLTILSFHSRALLSSWNASTSSSICSTWFGVFCSNVSRQQRVSALHLPGRSLYGPIATDTISRLDALNTLSLRSNKLVGSFPADLANLTGLGKLTLERNALTGALPSDFSQWPLLSLLDLSYNSFSGSIPPSLDSLTYLKFLYLQDNVLTGALPSLDHVTSLDSFNVANNNLSGPIPGSLQRFPSSSFAGNANLCGLPLTKCATSSGHHKRSRVEIAGIVLTAVGGTLLLIFLLSLCIWIVKHRRTRRRNRRDRGMGRDVRGEGIAAAGGLPAGEAIRESLAALPEGEDQNKKLTFTDGKQLFDLEDLLQASAEVLGKGTLGSSYKAVLENGQIVAVKRLQNIEEGGKEEYRKSLDAIGRVRHDNVVPLRAYYVGKDETLLVYDFMQNGSLSALLHGSRSAGINPLDWDTRFRIALTTATGLAAIHAHDIVHGSIKSSNVLLKSNLEGSVTDYGISPMMQPAPALPKSAGYMAPEVADPRRSTAQSDVYGYGILLLELLTGKAPFSPARPSTSSALPPTGSPALPGEDEAVDLPPWVQSVPRERWMAEVFDPLLVRSSQTAGEEEEMARLLQVAMACASPSSDQRPDMPTVVQMISSIRPSTDDDKSSDLSPRQYYAGASAQA